MAEATGERGGAGADDARLLAAARAAADRAYAPYSGVHVGAALLDAEGRVHLGCNVENVSYGLTICAERAALARAVADGARRFTALAIHACVPAAFPPCGACRQVLAEFAPDLRVVWQGDDRVPRTATMDVLLHDALRPADLPGERRGEGGR